jgi:hypothetical protein
MYLKSVSPQCKDPHPTPFPKKHKSKQLTLGSDLVCNHCTQFMFELHFFNLRILFFLQFIFCIYPRIMGRKYVDCEFYNLFLHEFK